MKRPNLRQRGAGGGSNFYGSGFHSTSLSIHNELRRLGISLPETVILGKPLRTDFGGLIIEREPARQCRAQLLETSGKHICHLWWHDGKNVSHTVEIKSGEAANLILFLRSENSPNQYFAYQPTSNTDPTPKTSDIPRFDKTMSFLVEVSYSHGSQRLRFPVNIIIGYDGRISYETPNSSMGF